MTLEINIRSVTIRICFGLGLSLMVSGCLEPEETIGPENWDIRIVPLVTYFAHDTTWVKLDLEGRPQSFCRLWDSSRCMEGTQFQVNQYGHLESSIHIENGMIRKDPIQFLGEYDAEGRLKKESLLDSNAKPLGSAHQIYRYDDEDRLIAIDYFPDTTSDSLAQSKQPASLVRSKFSRQFRYDSLGQLEWARILRGGDEEDSTYYRRDADGHCIALETGTLRWREFERNAEGVPTRMLVSSRTADLQTAYRFDYRDAEERFEPDPIWHQGWIPIWGY
jgi:hypothetical protein